ncbi:GNAT family N-acetyltransferase [Spirosoma aerolatum]|uniref:GNAT family N-acetyltransferase n=1 Tax=Spirosoma aerolatum TaxID=1211326 RepID=UPI0009ADF6C8|nr:GNAT family N-acetyltransferase [Spirosoma aerolatum]
MLFLPITSHHAYLIPIQTWYEEAFPIDERRDFAELTALLAYPDMHLCALVNDSSLVGFMLYWQWDEAIFVEHFAIDPHERGKQFGQQALAQLLELSFQYCLLEVERPDDETGYRRIRFYERQGFTLNPFDYIQPPYQPDKAPVPMRLMSIPAIPDSATYERLSQLIKERVYERFYDAN